MGDTTLSIVTTLQSEIRTLQDENSTLYEKIKSMEATWDALIQQTSQVEARKRKLEWEISKVRGELLTKASLLQSLDSENNELHASIIAREEDNKRLNDKLTKKIEKLRTCRVGSLDASEKYIQSGKAWKEERRSINKQREELTRKLDACEDELQAYFNENAKLEKHLKQVTKDFTSISATNQQIQELLDAKESNWQKLVRRLGPKHDCIQDTFKSALVASVGIESGCGLSPAGVLIANYVDYWRVLHGQNIKQLLAVINSLRDFLIEHFVDQDYVLYLLSCTSLVLYALHTSIGRSLDDQIFICLDDFHFLELAGMQNNKMDLTGNASGYSSDSSDNITEGTAGYASDSISCDYATDATFSGNESSGSGSSKSSSESPEPAKPTSNPKKALSRGKSLLSLHLNIMKPLLQKRPARKDSKSGGSKPPLMSDTNMDAAFSAYSPRATPTRIAFPNMSGHRTESGFVSPPSPSETNLGYSSPRGNQDLPASPRGFVTPRGQDLLASPRLVTPRGSQDLPNSTTRNNLRGSDYDMWQVTIRNTTDFFTELTFIFAMNLTALIRRIYSRLDEILEQSRVAESFAHFCAFRAHDQIGIPPLQGILVELIEHFNSVVSSFEVHMVYVSLSKTIFEEIFGRLGRMVANLVISRSSFRCEKFGSFLMHIWERLDGICRGNASFFISRFIYYIGYFIIFENWKEWTGYPEKQLSLIKQCATLLSLREKDKNLVESTKKREATFPDFTENQIRYISTLEFHSKHNNSNNNNHHGRTESSAARHLVFQDLDYIRPITIKQIHYLGIEEIQKLAVPPFLLANLGVE